jgi:hypothetical protein
MKKRSLIVILTMALVLLPALLLSAFAQKERVTTDSAGSGSGAGLSSGMIGIGAGQTARLSVWNGGDKAVQVQLRFIDGDGKVLFLSDSLVPPGQSFSDKFTNPGGDRLELRGEIRVDTQQGSDVLTPSLQVIDDLSGWDQVVLGSCDFKSVKS